MVDIHSAELLFEKANKLGLQPKWYTTYGLFSIQVNETEYFIFFSKSILNTALSTYLTSNKHVTRLIVNRENSDLNIPFRYSNNRKDIIDFLHLHTKIIGKPLLGRNGVGVTIITKEEEIPQTDLNHAIYEKYIEGKEVRYIVLAGKVIAVATRDGRIKETVEKLQWNSLCVKQAEYVSSLFHLGFCAVDFLIDTNGRAYLLEVNSAPSIYHFYKPLHGPSVDLATPLLEETVKVLRRE